jgi:hypothetical protein
MKVCDACGQVIRDLTREERLTRAELNALSAWWWARTTRGAARVLGLHEQTVKNQLWTARRRNQCLRTSDLAERFFGQLKTLEELTQHNVSRRVA